MPEIQKPKQKRRYTDLEMSLIKNTFAENEDLLKMIRKIFLQMPLSPIEATVIANIFGGNAPLMALIRKTFRPELDPEAPLHQLIDLWITVDIKEKSLGNIQPIFESRQLLLDILE